MIPFQLIGIMACVFAISVLLLNLRTSLQEKSQKPKFCRFLTGCCAVLWVLSFPVSVIAFFLNQPSSNRFAKLKSQLESRDFLCASKDRLISALEVENNRMKDQLLDFRNDSLDSHYVAGLRTGSKDGFVAGYEQCLAERGIPSNPDYSIHYINEAHSYSKQCVADYMRTIDLQE